MVRDRTLETANRDSALRLFELGNDAMRTRNYTRAVSMFGKKRADHEEYSFFGLPI